jgi:AcrR family transcriptional regulator
MKKSEHTEIYTLTRLAVFASIHGLSELTYGSAAKASHLSRGAIQRLFPSKTELQRHTLEHAFVLLCNYVFSPTQPALPGGSPIRWVDWIEGKAGLPGTCVLLNALSARALPTTVRARAWVLMNSFLVRLSDRPIEKSVDENRQADSNLALAMLLSAAMEDSIASVVRRQLLANLQDVGAPERTF